jgi:hypothetical protein
MMICRALGIRPAPSLAAAGVIVVAFALMPFANALAAAAAEGWLAVYMDAAAFRLFCL